MCESMHVKAVYYSVSPLSYRVQRLKMMLRQISDICMSIFFSVFVISLPPLGSYKKEGGWLVRYLIVSPLIYLDLLTGRIVQCVIWMDSDQN